MSRHRSRRHKTPNRRIRRQKSNIKILHKREKTRSEKIKIDGEWGYIIKRLMF